VLREIPQYPRLRADRVARVLSLTLVPSGRGARAAAVLPGCTKRRPVRCTLGTVPPGVTVTGLARVRVQIPAELHSVLYVSSHTPESNRTNNASLTNLTSIRRVQRVHVRVSAPARGRVGAPLRYRVTVSAAGARTVHGVRACTRVPATFTGRHAPRTFRYKGMRCRDYKTVRAGHPRSFAVTGVPAAGGPVTLRARAAAVGNSRVVHARAVTRISVQACAALASRLLC
jgi:hypothetical protein